MVCSTATSAITKSPLERQWTSILKWWVKIVNIRYFILHSIFHHCKKINFLIFLLLFSRNILVYDSSAECVTKISMIQAWNTDMSNWFTIWVDSGINWKDLERKNRANCAGKVSRLNNRWRIIWGTSMNIYRKNLVQLRWDSSNVITATLFSA